MKEELRRSDELREVVRAAEAWRAAGAIDDAALAAIRARHPDDRRRARPGFRLLFFVFTLLAVQALFFFCIALFGRGSLWGSEQALGSWQALFALACGFAAETSIASLRMRGFGIDEALVVLAVGFATGAVALLLGPAFESGSGARLVFAALAVSAAFAAWRWGIALAGVAAGIGLFGALDWTPAPRLAWLVAGSLGAVVAWRGERHPATAPAHRGRWSELYFVAVLALYAALHVWGFGTRRIDSLQSFIAWALDLPTGARMAAWAAMVAFPAGLVGWGVRERDVLTLTLGALLGVATGATALIELEWGPPWLRLMVGGAALLGAALAFRRRFAGRPQRLAGGFTDLPLFEARSVGLLEMAAAVAVFTPEPQPSPEPKGFHGDGGEFGGGGASGEF